MFMNKQTVICAKNIVKDYEVGGNTNRALNGVDLEITKGEFLMITGRNGSGKSTLLHLMALLDDLTSGTVTIGDERVSDLNERDKSRLRLSELGYIFQEYALIQELTALENVMLPSMMTNSLKDAKQKAEELLKKVDLYHKENRLPAQLSGGEQQRVAIARSLVNNPRIIFADEPTANLDSFASKEVLELFKKLNSEDDMTIIMVTHEPEELAYATRVVNLEDGKLHEK